MCHMFQMIKYILKLDKDNPVCKCSFSLLKEKKAIQPYLLYVEKVTVKSPKPLEKYSV